MCAALHLRGPSSRRKRKGASLSAHTRANLWLAEGGLEVRTDLFGHPPQRSLLDVSGQRQQQALELTPTLLLKASVSQTSGVTKYLVRIQGPSKSPARNVLNNNKKAMAASLDGAKERTWHGHDAEQLARADEAKSSMRHLPSQRRAMACRCCRRDS